jgi:heme O synthase-like polyprenyltransferase
VAGCGGAIFILKSWRLHRQPTGRNAMKNFRASLLQLALLIAGILLDGAFGSWP